ncbi:MAG: type II toxin-antitoxin system VapC family toxin [Patulibacter sp.]
MPDSAEPLLVDTSVAVPLIAADHASHDAVSQALVGRELGLSGHAALETYSVLTRLPGDARRSPQTVAKVLAVSFPATVFLKSSATGKLFASLAERGIAGGAVYDALVGAAAVAHHRTLVTRDQRALETYRALGVELLLLG